MSRPLRVAVVGAGLGGLVAANALLKRGFEVSVYEQASKLSEVGAGIQITPNAVKVLRALGLEQALMRVGFEPEGLLGLDWKSARMVFRSPLKSVVAEKYGARHFHVHRADLHRILFEAMPGDCIRLSARCTGITNRPDAAVLRVADGSEAEADVVVGADGIHSAVRASMLGPENPRFTGCMCWRALIPSARLPEGLVPPTVTNWLGPGGHVVHYYVRGGEWVNLVAVREARHWIGESWTIPSSPEEMLAAYPGWHKSVRTLLAQAEHVFSWSLLDRDPLERWSVARVTLLGDAAHPMLPFLAQGAAMAMEDGYVLARQLAERPNDLSVALAGYEALRRPRTTRVQLAVRERRHALHLSSSWARIRRNLAYKWHELRDPTGSPFGVEWIYKQDVTLPAHQPL